MRIDGEERDPVEVTHPPAGADVPRAQRAPLLELRANPRRPAPFASVRGGGALSGEELLADLAGKLKRTSSSTVLSSEMSSAPRSRKKVTSPRPVPRGRWPRRMLTVSTPRATHVDLPWLSIRYESAPKPRATSTSRFEFEEFVDPTRAQGRTPSRGLHRHLAVRGRVTDVVGLARPRSGTCLSARR